MNPADELNAYLAHVQARLAFFLVIVLVLLVLAVVAILLLPHIVVNPAVTNLLVQVVTGVLALAGTACGFFFARMRPGGIPDATVTQTHTSPDGTKSVIVSPAATTSVSVPPIPPVRPASQQEKS
jgi:hypothetical protein